MNEKNKYIPIMRQNFNDNVTFINDPIFGNLRYRKNYRASETNLQNKVCPMPFSSVEINTLGQVYVCCSDWNPASIGDVLEQDIKTIWHNYKSDALRQSILDGSYKYCNLGICETIRNQELINRKELKNRYPILEFPTNIRLSIDQSCNLQCPSCRTKKINHLDEDEKNKVRILAKNIFSSVFSKPHNQYIKLSMDGSGEIFGSEVYRELFQTETVFNETYKWPMLEFEITTNGTLMTEKIQKKYINFFKQTKNIFISIDAGNKESYDIVRLGGNWDLLWENINYFYQSIKNSQDKRWTWTLIIQKDNLDSIPEFINRALYFKENLPYLNMTHLVNWGTFTEEQYLDRAVFIPTHPLYQKYQEIINSNLIKNYKRKLYGGS